jgi:hypothetical protein
MRTLHLSFIGATAALAIGCAGHPQLANLKQRETPAEPVVLPSNICTNFTGAFGKDAEACVLAGTYRIEKENALGQLFRGDLPSVYWKIGDDVTLVHGGIWLPRDSGVAPRIYFYQTAGFIKGKSVAEVENARVAMASKAPVDSTQVATTVAIQNIPTNATPVQAGLGAGIATGIVSALIGDEPLPGLYGEPKSPLFVESIRRYFPAERRAP